MSQDFIERPHKNEKEGAIAYVQELLKQAREDRRNDDVEKLENLIRLLNTKKYGLVWEEHAELVEEEMKTKIPVFIEDETKKIVGNPESEDYNFLLEGDNLHSLHLLKKTHAGAIDVIYIDPPYNTGNKDFVYNDKIVDKTDGYSHSKWLSFMSKRLKMAKELLSDSGLIFVSIDDNEQSQLKLLMDEIFGARNYLNTIVIKAKTSSGASGGGEDKRLKKNTEFLLLYSKSKEQTVFETPTFSVKISEYIREHKENKIGFYYTRIVEDFGDRLLVSNDENMKVFEHRNFKFSTVKEKMTSEKLSLDEVYYKYFDRIFMVTNAQTSLLTKVNNIISEKGKLISYDYVPKSGKFKGKQISKFVWNQTLVVWFSDSAVKTKDGIYKISQLGNLWADISWGRLDKQGDIIFKNGKKPILLVKRIIKMLTNKNASILDFFAGSGTTGHAVAQLNKEDGGNRKYILCTNNENNICEEVTYKRLTNIQGELPHNLKYFKTDFVVKEEFPDVTLEYELLNYVAPLVELEFGVDISNPKVQVILSEEQLDSMKESDFIENSTLFIHPEVFFDSKQERILREKNITKQEIPDYYFGKDIWS